MPEDLSLIVVSSFEQYEDLVNNHLNGIVDTAYLRRHVLDVEYFAKMYGMPSPVCDPFSSQYLEWEIGFFEFLSGKPYNYVAEGLSLDALTEQQKPPTVDWSLEHRIERTRLYMEVLERIQPQQGACVLEMGFGYGDLLEWLGRCGCKVFGIDASEDFLAYALHRLTAQSIQATLSQGSFYDVEYMDVFPEIVIFEASFHHCGEPVRLLEILHKKLAPNGKIYFFNEPILPHADRPWGLIRYDGESLFQIRYRGWLEFGFRLDFFEALLSKTGYKIANAHLMSNGYTLYEAMKV
jgi:SAM-dependent methyltransferase